VKFLKMISNNKIISTQIMREISSQ